MIQTNTKSVKIRSWKFRTTEFAQQLPESIIMALEHRNYWQDTLINSGMFLAHNLPEIMKDVEQCTINRGLNLNDNSDSKIIYEIEHIKFCSLQWLSLRGNNLESIQRLSMIWMPQIKRLFLDSNNLTKSQPLKKCNFPLLTQLQIHNNYFVDFQDIASSLMTRNIKEIGIQHPGNRHMVTQLNFITKLQAKQLNQIWVISPQRIETLQIYNSLLQKYVDLTICRK